MNNANIFSRFDFVKGGMLKKKDPQDENIDLINKFRKLNRIYSAFLLDNITIGHTNITINGETKCTILTKEVVEVKRNYSLSSIVAVTKNNVIGISEGNQLPWKHGTQKADMKRFVELTKGNVVVLGRKTFESFGSRPLKDRIHVIITNDFNFQVSDQYKDQCYVVHSIKQSFDCLDKLAETRTTENEQMKVFVIGGAQIYEQFMPYIDNIFLTKIMVISIDGDVFFPKIDMNEWKFDHNEPHPEDADNLSPYHFRLHERIKIRNRKKEISEGIVKQFLLSFYLEKL